MHPTDGQSVLPLPAPNPAQPPLVLPLTTGPAIADPNSALLQQVFGRAVRRAFLPLLSVAVLGLFLAPAATEHQFTGLVFVGSVLALVLASMVATLWVYVPQRRRGEQLLQRYAWRAVPATLLADRPCLVRIELDEQQLTLRLRRFNWMAKQALLRTGTLWICGPDPRGRALVRLAGFANPALADVTDAVPTGVPPVLVRPSSPRPIDDPALIWARRVVSRNRLITAAVLVLFDGVAIGLLSRSGTGGADPALIGWLVVESLVLVLIGYSALAGRRQFQRYAAASCWQPVPVTLDTWDAATAITVRTGTGRIILPGGWTGYVEFPRLSLDLAANLRATGVLWLAGDAAPGRTVPIGVPGLPLRGVVTIKQ